MTRQQRLVSYMKMWEVATQKLGLPFTPRAYEDLSAYLLGRDVLEEEPRLAQQVQELDRQFIRALATSSTEWQRNLDDMMSRMGLDQVAWWRRLRQAAAEERAGNLKEIAA